MDLYAHIPNHFTAFGVIGSGDHGGEVLVSVFSLLSMAEFGESWIAVAADVNEHGAMGR